MNDLNHTKSTFWKTILASINSISYISSFDKRFYYINVQLRLITEYSMFFYKCPNNGWTKGLPGKLWIPLKLTPKLSEKNAIFIINIIHAIDR